MPRHSLRTSLTMNCATKLATSFMVLGRFKYLRLAAVYDAGFCSLCLGGSKSMGTVVTLYISPSKSPPPKYDGKGLLPVVHSMSPGSAGVNV